MYKIEVAVFNFPHSLVLVACLRTLFGTQSQLLQLAALIPIIFVTVVAVEPER